MKKSQAVAILMMGTLTLGGCGRKPASSGSELVEGPDGVMVPRNVSSQSVSSSSHVSSGYRAVPYIPWYRSWFGGGSSGISSGGSSRSAPSSSPSIGGSSRGGFGGSSHGFGGG